MMKPKTNIEQTPDGRWQVENGKGDVIAGPFATNAEAWRWVDRSEGEAVSPQERKVDWLWRQQLRG